MKKALSIIMAVVILICAAPLSGIEQPNSLSINASSADADDALTFARINGKMAVKSCLKTFEGRMEIPSQYNGEPVEVIGSDAFRECSGLTEIIVPDSVTSIGRTAFIYCTALKDITLSDNLAIIGDEAFEHCGISEITIPPGVESIGDRVFQGCSNLVTVNFYSTLKTLDNSAFHNCRVTNVYYSGSIIDWNKISFLSGIYNTGVPFDAVIHYNSAPRIKEQEGIYNNISWIRYDGEVMILDCDESVEGNIVIPQTIEGYPVTTICTSTFSRCKKITGVEIPEGIKTIWNSAFFDCSELKTKVTIPSSVTLCGKGIFASCVGLKDIAVAPGNPVYDSRNNCKAIIEISTDTLISGCSGSVIPDDIKSIGENAFYGTAFRNGNLPEGLRFIGRYAFAHSLMENIVLPESVEIISDYAFNWADSLKTVEMPASLKKIGEQAFSYCRHLKEVTVPSKTEYIGRAAFLNCNELESITLPDSITYISRSAFTSTSYFSDNSNWENDVLYVGNHLIKARETVSGDYQIKQGTKTIAEYAFNGCGGLKSAIVPDSVVTICDNAFSQCTNLVNVLINGNTDFEKDTFKDSDKVTLVILDEDIPNTKVFADLYGVNRVDVVYNPKKNVLSFDGTTTVYEGENYDYITESLRKYPEAEYMFFGKIVFNGIKKDDFMFELDDDVDARIIDSGSEDLTLNHLYVNINLINEEGSGKVTFDYMLNALKNGSGEAFSIVLDSDEGQYGQSVSDKIVDRIVEHALNAMSRIINFFARRFNKKK